MRHYSSDRCRVVSDNGVTRIAGKGWTTAKKVGKGLGGNDTICRSRSGKIFGNSNSLGDTMWQPGGDPCICTNLYQTSILPSARYASSQNESFPAIGAPFQNPVKLVLAAFLRLWTTTRMRSSFRCMQRLRLVSYGFWRSYSFWV